MTSVSLNIGRLLAGLSISETADQGFRTGISRIYREWPEKEEMSCECQFSWCC